MRYVITVNETSEDRRIKHELAAASRPADHDRRRELKQLLNRSLSYRASALSAKLSLSELGARIIAVGRGEITVVLEAELSDERKREIETAHDCRVTLIAESDTT